MHLQVVQVVTLVVAFTLSATRVLKASQWVWGYLPKWLAGILPGLVVALPALGELIAGATTWTDVSVALFLAVGLAFPGAPSHSVPLKKPPVENALLVFLMASAGTGALTACALFGASGPVWPAVAHCVPSKESLVSEVASILLRGGDYQNALESLAVREGASALECAVHAAIDSLTGGSGKVGAGVDPDKADAVARGRTFLEKTGTTLHFAPGDQ